MPDLFRLFSVKIVELFKKIPSHFILPIIFFSLGLISFIVGLMQYIFSFWNRENIQNNNFTKSKSISQLQNDFFTPSVITPEIKMFSIDIEGAVQNPGVYTVSSSGRLQDALIASGGLDANADRAWIGKNLNLAQSLADGTKIYIPRLGEQVAAAETTSNSLNISDNFNPSNSSNPSNPPSPYILSANSESTSKPAKKIRKSSTKKTKKQKSSQQNTLGVSTVPVSINNATLEELSTLPGVKAATAQKIITRRPYASLDDLLKKKSVSKRVFEKIKERITL